MKSPASKPLNAWTASEIVAAIGAGRTTCEAVMRACLDRIAAREAEVAAWTNLDPARALAAARAFDRNPASGPLAGVPFGLKDIIDTQDYPTEWGTPIHRGRRPNRDAACVALTRRAGGVLLGKTVYDRVRQSASRSDPQSARSRAHAGRIVERLGRRGRRPHGADRARHPDHGSTIRPASFCGVFGYRPTHGEHRLHGVMEASGSLDTLGILARSLDDIALYRDVLLGISPQQIADVAKAPRIGLYRPQIWDQVEPTTRRLVEDAARSLAKAGADIHDVKLPEVFAGLNEAHRWISSFEFARTFTWEIEHHWNEISETLRNGRVADGLSCGFERYIDMQKLAEACRRQFDALWQDYDIMLTASAFGEAPVGWNTFVGAPLYMMSTALHVPSVSLPVLTGPSNMPIGLQILARRHDDRKLFAWARWAYRQLS